MITHEGSKPYSSPTVSRSFWLEALGYLRSELPSLPSSARMAARTRGEGGYGFSIGVQLDESLLVRRLETGNVAFHGSYIGS